MLLHSFILAIVSFFLAVLIAISYKAPGTPNQPSEFKSANALQFLQVIASSKHPFGSVANSKLKDFLLQKLSVYKNSNIDLITTNNTLSHNGTIFQSSNLALRIRGKSSKALLISSHYDSVPSSFGATDDGASVAIMLELARNLAEKNMKYTCILLFNNGEESGLLGSQSFLSHPWYTDVGLFINSEGAGSGGRQILFRTTNPALPKLYSSTVPYPHGNSFGGDLVDLDIISSTTDFETFSKSGVNGIDLAFYERRATYHTSQDRIERISADSLQFAGSNILAFATQILDPPTNTPDYLGVPLPAPLDSHSSLYGDVYGKTMFSMSAKEFFLYITVLVLVFAVLAFARLIQLSWSQSK